MYVHLRTAAALFADETIQARAAEYIAGIKQSPECWKLCVERFGSSGYPEVRFWCLQTLQEVSGSMHACVLRHVLELQDSTRCPEPCGALGDRVLQVRLAAASGY